MGSDLQNITNPPEWADPGGTIGGITSGAESILTGNWLTGRDDPLTLGSFLDPLDLFGQRGASDIADEGAAARERISSLMRTANTMRQDVLARIQERDLRASRRAAKARIETRRRTGRASTILSR